MTDDLFNIMGKENDRLKLEGLKTDQFILELFKNFIEKMEEGMSQTNITVNEKKNKIRRI